MDNAVLKTIVEDTLRKVPFKRGEVFKQMEKLNQKAQQNIIQKYQNFCNEEDMIGFLSTGFLENGKKGFLLGTQGLFGDQLARGRGTTKYIIFEQMLQIQRESQTLIKIRTKQGEELIDGSIYANYLTSILEGILNGISEHLTTQACFFYDEKQDHKYVENKLIEIAGKKSPEQYGQFSVGERVEFGSYSYEADGKENVIDWVIVDKKENAVLLVTDKIIESLPFSPAQDLSYITITSDELQQCDWETSDIRKWLNHDFAEHAFTDEEYAAIQTTTVLVTGDDLLETKEEKTKDRIFLLSAEELLAYFGEGEDENRNHVSIEAENGLSWGVLTPYAMKREMNTEFGICSWTRSSTIDGTSRISFEEETGEFYWAGEDVSTYLGIRPAMWVKTKF